jgi:hypothetical protein
MIQRNEFGRNKVLWFNASVTYGHSGVFSPFPSQFKQKGGKWNIQLEETGRKIS